MRILSLTMVALTSMLVATGCSAEDAAATQDEIMAGQVSTEKAVVIIAQNAQQECSGTLIAPDVVLTAAHCSSPLTHVYVGYSKSSLTSTLPLNPGPGETWQRIAIAERVLNPNWYRSQGECPLAANGDVALLRLESPVKGVIPLSLAATSPVVGDRCEVIGFGRHNATGGLRAVESEVKDWRYSERRKAKVRVTSVSDDRGQLVVKGIDGAESNGDSGGLLFCKGKVAGVVSCTVDRDKRVLDLEKGFGTVLGARSFIDEQMRKWNR
jgi:Trypsin